MDLDFASRIARGAANDRVHPHHAKGADAAASDGIRDFLSKIAVNFLGGKAGEIALSPEFSMAARSMRTRWTSSQRRCQAGCVESIISEVLLSETAI
jgi:hypothetical protein